MTRRSRSRSRRWWIATAVTTAALGGLAPTAALAADETVTQEVATQHAGAPTGQVWYDDQGNRHEVLYNGKLIHLRDRAVRGACPSDYRFLHGGTSSPKLTTALGFVVRDNDAAVRPVERILERRYETLAAYGSLVTATTIYVGEWMTFQESAVYVEMVCTKNPAWAWRP